MEQMLKRSSNKTLQVALTLENVSPVTRLLEKKKQQLQVQESLDAQKEEYSRKEELFKRREENLRKKDLELQEALVLFNKFLKENEYKRRRADYRAQEEKKKIHQTILSIEKENQKLDKKKKDLEKKIKDVAKNEKYLQFLQMVYDENENHFDELSSIITRYDTLAKANQDLQKKQKELTKQNEDLRTEFNNYKKKVFNETLSLNNDIASRSKDLDQAVTAANDAQHRLMQTEATEANMKEKTTQIIMAVENLFTRCKKGLLRDTEFGSQKTGLIKHTLQKFTDKELQKCSEDVMWKKKEETIRRLDVICYYLLDFKQMVDSINLSEGRKGARPNQAYSRSSYGIENDHTLNKQSANQYSVYSRREEGDYSGSVSYGNGDSYR